MNNKYEEPLNKTWHGATFSKIRDDKYGGSEYRVSARCKHCNKFFNYKNVQAEIGLRSKGHCPHCKTQIFGSIEH